jgi:pyruvate, water dikinase
MGLLNFFKKEDKKNKSNELYSLEKVVFHFGELLRENNEILALMADLEEKAGGHFLFDMSYLRGVSRQIDEKVGLIITHLTTIAPQRYDELKEIYRQIHQGIEDTLNKKKWTAQGGYTLGLDQITAASVFQTGGKNAHLGEVKNILRLPTPEGFAITTSAYLQFLSSGPLQKNILSLLQDHSPLKDQDRLYEVEREVKDLILKTSLPHELEEALLEAAQTLWISPKKSAGLALRSSAILEDSQYSFAGQYATFLNITPDQVPAKYKEVVASQFSSRALFYMKSKGLIEEDMAMAVACQLLVPAVASGVLFTRQQDPEEGEVVLINALWGLGKWVVDGTVSPDLYMLDKKTGRLIRQQISEKIKKLVPEGESGLKEENVPKSLQTEPCLNAQQLTQLWKWAELLESHFQHIQDVEWALNPEGELIILQTRNLRGHERLEKKRKLDQWADEYPLLLEGGAVGAYGVGSGPVFTIRNPEDLAGFPKGAVLVASNTSSQFVSIMDRAAAIITDVGSATGHMAILAREFHVPTLVDTQNATRYLENGQEVTVDSFNARVYAGRVEPLLRNLPKEDPLLLNTPVYEKLQEVLPYITPLNLVDPKSENFKPLNCRTLHDIIRFSHEKSIEEMFNLSEREDLRQISAIEIKMPLPFNLYLLDLGGGLKKDAGRRSFTPENVLSVPFQALWKGIMTPGISWAGPIGVNVKGLLSVMAQSATQSTEDFWDRTLALVSSHYLNFSSRLGYHFATVDSFCGQNRNDNYVTFVFKGGAADPLRRGRRVRFLGKILEGLGFEVAIKEDMIKAQYRKFPESMTKDRLEDLGRLMGCARQLDMVMADDVTVDWYAQAFLSGNYGFKRE